MSDPFQKQPPPEPEPGGQPGQPGQQPPYGAPSSQGYGAPGAYPPPTPPGQPGYPQPGVAPGQLSAGEEATWVGAAHWGALVASFIGGLAFLGPLLVLLIKGNESPRVRWHAVESLNFQLSFLIYFV